MTEKQENLLEEVAQNLAQLNDTLRILTNYLQSSNNSTKTVKSILEPINKHYSMEKQIIDMLNKLEIPSHLKGYLYLKEGLLYCIKNNRIPVLSTELYPAIHKICYQPNTKAAHIGTAIYHAIQCAWQNKDCEYREKMFRNYLSYPYQTPSISEFFHVVLKELKKTKNMS